MLIEVLRGYGLVGIFILALMEAIFLPVPVETLLIPFLIVKPKLYVLAVVLSTGGSVLGAMVGHTIGKIGGKKIVYKYINNNKIDKVHELFNRYGTFAVAIAALTPLPYKIFAIISGILDMKREKLAIIALISRGIRFLIVGFITIRYGGKFFAKLNSTTIDVKILVILSAIFIIYLVSKIITHKER